MNALTIAPPSAVAAVTAATPPLTIQPAQPLDVDPAAHVNFMDRLQSAVHAMDEDQRTAEDKMAAVDSGRSDDLVGAMLASQQASTSFALLLQVRNKIAGALDDLLKLQL